MKTPQIIDLNPDNIPEFGLGCISNPKHTGFQAKFQWAVNEFKQGLKMKLIRADGKTCGFIEFMPGENCWRGIEAKGYLVIHCIWVYNKEFQNKRYGSILIEDCLDYAKKEGFNGVAVVTSDGPWMAKKNLFQKNGFKIVDSAYRFELLAKTFRNTELPSFKDWESKLKGYRGLHLLYCSQCPYVAKSAGELSKTAIEQDVKFETRAIQKSKEARNGPSIYGVCGLIYNDELIVDHYTSKTRFRNILTKDLALSV